MGLPENENNLMNPVTENQYDNYLRDESRVAGNAETISFPNSEEDVIKIMRYLFNKGIPVTLQGARTGVTAGAVPFGGHIMNLSKMNKIKGLKYDACSNRYIITVQPGVLLSEIRDALRFQVFDTNGWTDESMDSLVRFKQTGPWFFPPDPTETKASIGGMIACNASGPLSFYYGATRKYIYSLRIVLSDGTSLQIKRGKEKSKGKKIRLELPELFLSGEVPSYIMPDVKNASGYFSTENMDLVDLFAGSEGTLGIITESEIMIIPEPVNKCGIMAFFPSESCTVDFVVIVRDYAQKKQINLAAIEFFDNASLNLLTFFKKNHIAYEAIPDIPELFHTALYLEFHCNTKEEIDNIIDNISFVLDSNGGNIDHTWVAVDNAEIEKLRFFRHAVPETVNILIAERRKKDEGIIKLGTDMAVPDHFLKEIISMYSDDLANSGLEAVKFGHIGDNHIHVNILPQSTDEYEKGRNLYEQWAQKVVAAGGTVSAEHGIGKLKTDLLKQMYGARGLEDMKAVKAVFDSLNLLNRGNLFEA